MNLLDVHNRIKKENEILKIQSKLFKEKDEKKQDQLKAEIIRLNGKINVKEIARIG